MEPGKYRRSPTIDLPDRRWPSATIERAPTWCSVDLRDGNQALIDPMGVERKHRMWRLLVDIGFKEIEVGFPSASQTEYDFIRELIEQDLIPEDVTIQVLTQARPELIGRTFEALRGAKTAIVHLYNSTSGTQRRVVFGTDRAGVTKIATAGAELVAAHAARMPETKFVLEYSPESFTQTEIDFALEICEAVTDIWKPTATNRTIINLPATVEVETPNVYADRIEYFGRHVRNREALIISVHPHNDRGTGIAAAELALLAGAQRVEGCLFGNGERTGNVDIITLALNLYTQGIDPALDISDINRIVAVAEECNRIPVHPRHPYAGDLVFTAFSGSHQDAIRKGMAAAAASPTSHWDVPYLPMDAKDIGRSYEAIIRINSQSGKGGVAYVLESTCGYSLPRGMQVDFSRIIQRRVEQTGEEIDAEEVCGLFKATYLDLRGYYELIDHTIKHDASPANPCIVEAMIRADNITIRVCGRGKGPIDAFINGLHADLFPDLRVSDYAEHAIASGSDATAIAYVELDYGKLSIWGAGQDADIVQASFLAILNGINRAIRAGILEPRDPDEFELGVSSARESAVT